MQNSGNGHLPDHCVEFAQGADQVIVWVGLTSHGYFDTDIYGSSKSKFEGYEISIPTNEAEEDEDDYSASALGQPKRATYTAPVALLNDIPQGEQFNAFAEHKQPTIAEREDDYRARRRKMIISPERNDPFAEAMSLKTPDPSQRIGRSYAEILMDQRLRKEE
ncbi:splicing factor 3B subunit 1 isoform X1, partial [Paramuricea clavata]